MFKGKLPYTGAILPCMWAISPRTGKFPSAREITLNQGQFTFIKGKLPSIRGKFPRNRGISPIHR